MLYSLNAPGGPGPGYELPFLENFIIPALVEIAELFLSADSTILAEIAALLQVGAPGVENVARASKQALGRNAEGASKVSAKIGRNIAAAMAPLLAGLLRLLSFQGNPDPLGCFRLIVKNRRFRQQCFGETDLLGELTSSETVWRW